MTNPRSLCWLLVALACTIGCQSSKDADPASPNSPGPCAQLNHVAARVLKDNPVVADIVYTPFVAPRPPLDVRQVNYEAAVLYVPARSFVCVPEYHANDSYFSLVLLDTEHEELVSIDRMEGREPMDDVFQIAGDERPAPERVADTRELFGKAPALFDLLDVGWKIAASEFRCNPQELSPARRDAVALILKTVATAAWITAVHRDVGYERSQVIREKGPRRQTVHYHFEDGNTYYTMSASGPGDELVNTVLAWLPNAGTALDDDPSVKPWDPTCRRIMSFLRQPSAANARKLIEDLPKNERMERITTALKFYLDTAPPTPPE